jgi:hypothetical protein
MRTKKSTPKTKQKKTKKEKKIRGKTTNVQKLT